MPLLLCFVAPLLSYFNAQDRDDCDANEGKHSFSDSFLLWAMMNRRRAEWQREKMINWGKVG
jgi:hypothetical protein